MARLAQQFRNDFVNLRNSPTWNDLSKEEQQDITRKAKLLLQALHERDSFPEMNEAQAIAETEQQFLEKNRADQGPIEKYVTAPFQRGMSNLAAVPAKLVAFGLDVVGADETANEMRKDVAERQQVVSETVPGLGKSYSELTAGDVPQFITDVVGENLPTMLTTGLAGRAITGASVAGKVISPTVAGTTATYGLMSLPEVYTSVKEAGGGAGSAALFAAPHAIIENLGGITPTKVVSWFKRGAAKEIASKGLKNFLFDTFKGVLGEGSEEVVQGMVEMAARHFSTKPYDQAVKDFANEVTSPEAIEQMKTEFAGGAAFGVAGGGVAGAQRYADVKQRQQAIAQRKGGREFIAKVTKIVNADAGLSEQMTELKKMYSQETEPGRKEHIMQTMQQLQRAKRGAPSIIEPSEQVQNELLTNLRAPTMQRQAEDAQGMAQNQAFAQSFVEPTPETGTLADYFNYRAGNQQPASAQPAESYAYPTGIEGLQLMVLDDLERRQQPNQSIVYDPNAPENRPLLPYQPAAVEGRQLPDGGIVKESKNDDIITLKSGEPFKSQKAAQGYQAKNNLKASHDIVTTRGGFVLMKKAAQQQAKRITVETPRGGDYNELNVRTEKNIPTENRTLLRGNPDAAARLEKKLLRPQTDVILPQKSEAGDQADKKQWYIDADDMPVFTTKSDSMGYRGPYSKQEIKDLTEVDPATLTEKNYGKEATLARREQAVTKNGYKVESYQGGFRVLDPEGKQYSWHTGRQAADDKAADLNSGKIAPVKSETKPVSKPETQPATRITAENAEMLANAQRLRKSAASLLDQAKADLNRDRQTNTARRARMAAGATDDAANREAFAKTMINLADAMERGEVRYLKGVKSRPDLMLFKNELTLALGRHARKNDKAYDWYKKEPVTDAAIRDGAEFNRPHPYGDWFDHAAKELEAIQGMKPAAAYIEKLGRGNRSRNVSLSDEAIGKILDIKKTIAKKGIKTPYQFARILETVEDYQKLKAAGIKSDFDLADALIEYRNLEAGKKQESPLVKAERELIGKKFEGFDFFPTPPALAERMAQELDIKPGMKVLEPSAGKGDLADAVKAAQPEADVKVIEPLSDLREILTMKNHEVIDTNFENFETDQKFDRVIMNPPFSKNRDIKHVRKAYELLAPGGKMVAVMGNHFTFANDKESVEFRDWLDTVGGASENLGQAFAGKEAFRQTGVNSQLVTIEKPAETRARTEPVKTEVSGQTVETPPAASVLVKPEEKDFGSATDYLKALTAWREKTGNITVAEAKRRDRALRFADRAAKTGQKASGLFRQADKISERFYMGQPILVGHHSERGARAAQNRMHNKMDAALKEEKKAEYYSQRAESAEKNKSISSADEDAIVKLKAKLESLSKVQERMKQANKVVKASKLSDAEKITKLQEQGFSEAKAKNLLEKDFAGRVGFPAYALQNNNAEMSRLKKRIEELSVKQSQQTQKIEFDGGEIVDNVAENRLQIFFDSKPDEATREKLKSNGFRWTPSAGAWQMHRSTWANRKAESITGAKIPAAQPAQAAAAEDKQEIKPESAKEPLYSFEYLVANYAAKGLKEAAKVVRAGFNYMRTGLTRFADWAKVMLKQFGKSIGPKLRAMFADLTAVLQSRRGMIRIAGWKSPQMIENIQRVSDRARASQRSMSEISSVYTGMDFRREASINRMGSLSQPMSGDLIDRLEAVGATPYDDNSGVARRNAANRRFREQQAAAYAKIAAKEIIEPVSQRAKEASEAFFKEWLERFGSRRGAALNLGGDAMTIFLNGATKFADWARALVKKYGKSINGMLKNMWTSVNNFAKSLGRTGAIGGKRPAGSVPKSFGVQSKDLQWVKDNKKQLRLVYNGQTVATLERRKPGGWRWVEANKAWARNELADAKATVKSTIFEELKRAERESAKYKAEADKRQKAEEARNKKHDDYFMQPTPTAPAKPRLALKERIKNFIARAGDVLVDRWGPALRLQQQVAKNAGIGEVSEGENFYRKLELLANRIGNRTEQFKAESFEPIVDYLNKNKISYEQFNRFLRIMHAEERNNHVFEINPEFRRRAAIEPDNPNYAGSGITTKEARAEIERMKQDGTYDTYFAAGKMYWDLNKTLLNMQVKYGLMAPEVRDTLNSKYEYYAPLKSMTEDSTKLDWRALGRRSESSDQLAHTEKAIEATFSYGENARVRRAFARFAINHPMPGLYEINRAVKKPYFDENTGEVKYRLDQYEKREELLFVPTSTGGLVMRIKDPALLAVLKNQNDLQLGDFPGPYLRSLNRFLGAVNTSVNPEFMFVNLLRDIQTAAVSLSAEESSEMAANVVLGIPRAAITAYEFKAGENNADVALYKEFMRQGGKIGYRDIYKLENAAEKLKARMAETQAGGTWFQTKEGMKAIRDLIVDANDVIESATRFSAYKEARNMGMSKEKASSIAANVTLNFQKRGTAGQILNAMYLFSTASIGGSARVAAVTAKAATSKTGKALISGAIAFGFMIDIINRILSDIDPDDDRKYWDKISAGEKDMNYMIMLPGQKENPLKLPMPHGFNVFPAIGRNISAMLFGEQTAYESVGNVMNTLRNAFSPIGTDERGIAYSLIPTAVKAPADVMLGRKWTGKRVRPDQPQFNAEMPRSQLINKDTNKMLVGITQALNAIDGDGRRPGTLDFSAADIQYLIEHYLGGAGKTVTRGFDVLWRIGTGQEIPPGNVPFVRRFYGSNTDFEAFDTFKKNRDEVERYNAAKREDDKAWMQANKWLSVAKQRYSETDKRLGDIKKDATLDDDQKRDAMMIEQKRFNRDFEKIRKQYQGTNLPIPEDEESRAKPRKQRKKPASNRRKKSVLFM